MLFETFTREMAQELLENELTLDELETDMSTHIEMQSYIERQLDVSDEQKEEIIDNAFELAKEIKNSNS